MHRILTDMHNTRNCNRSKKTSYLAKSMSLTPIIIEDEIIELVQPTTNRNQSLQKKTKKRVAKGKKKEIAPREISLREEISLLPWSTWPQSRAKDTERPCKFCPNKKLITKEMKLRKEEFWSRCMECDKIIQACDTCLAKKLTTMCGTCDEGFYICKACNYKVIGCQVCNTYKTACKECRNPNDYVSIQKPCYACSLLKDERFTVVIEDETTEEDNLIYPDSPVREKGIDYSDYFITPNQPLEYPESPLVM